MRERRAVLTGQRPQHERVGKKLEEQSSIEISDLLGIDICGKTRLAHRSVKIRAGNAGEFKLPLSIREHTARVQGDQGPRQRRPVESIDDLAPYRVRLRNRRSRGCNLRRQAYSGDHW